MDYSGTNVSDAIRVAIADDQDLVRKGFRLILSSFPDIKVVGEAVVRCGRACQKDAPRCAVDGYSHAAEKRD